MYCIHQCMHTVMCRRWGESKRYNPGKNHIFKIRKLKRKRRIRRREWEIEWKNKTHAHVATLISMQNERFDEHKFTPNGNQDCAIYHTHVIHKLNSVMFEKGN